MIESRNAKSKESLDERMGRLSSDRAVEEYARGIWRLSPPDAGKRGGEA